MSRILVLAVLTFLAVGGDAYAQAHPEYDSLNGVTAADDPWTSANILPVTATFNNAAFTETEEYESGPNSAQVYAGCGAWGARTAWVRFATRVKGRVAV